jgi:DNA-binding response OmpR family regulator
MAAGADDFVAKPFTARLLKEKITRFLGQDRVETFRRTLLTLISSTEQK